MDFFCKKLFIRLNRKLRKGIYVLGGRRPWSFGYSDFKEAFISSCIDNKCLVSDFLENRHLPERFGYGLDERVVEYPWILSRISESSKNIMDAGSVLNFDYILKNRILKNKSIMLFNLTLEDKKERPNITYCYGDLRETRLDNESFDEIICISTLEHVGMDNTFLYSKDKILNESSPQDYKKVMRELSRLLKPAGKLLLTVPFGVYENLGWLQQFDKKMIDEVIEEFNGKLKTLNFYRYKKTGWQIATEQECQNCAYFDIHSKKNYSKDLAAAARAVACLELIRDDK